MSMQFESEAKTLKITGVSAGFYEASEGRPGGLQMTMFQVKDGQSLLQEEKLIGVPLTDDWKTAIREKGLELNGGVEIELERADPQTGAEKALHDVLFGPGVNVYAIKSIQEGPNPFAAYV